MSGTIVVTATGTAFPSDFAFPDAGFGIFITVDGLNVNETAVTGPNNYYIPDAKNAPKSLIQNYIV